VVEGQSAVEGLARSEGAIAADHGGFDRLAVDQFDHIRNDAAMWEVDLQYWLVSLSEHLALLQVQHGYVGRHTGQRRRIHSVEKEVMGVDHRRSPLPCRREHYWSLRHRRPTAKPAAGD